jgi:hypothetical protein
MTIHFTWPSVQDAQVVDEIREAIGRNVTFHYLVSTSGCPVCSLDPVTNESTDSFCTTCSGEYWIPSYSGEAILAHVNWGFSEQLGWYTGGQQMEGDCRIQIKYTVTNIDIVDKTKWIEVDGRNMLIVKRILRGVQPLNRIILDLSEKDKL